MNTWLRQLWGAFCLISLGFPSLYAQSALPLSPEMERGLARNSRSIEGRPGPAYFVNHTAYTLEARLDPATNLLQGEGTLRFTNNSPDTLQEWVLRLYQDLYKEGQTRNLPVDDRDLTKGVRLHYLLADGDTLPLTGKDSLVTRQGTHALVSLAGRPHLPGTTRELKVGWSFSIPRYSHVRMGQYDTTTYFIGYWYPQMAVYDDVRGWDRLDHQGLQEFYLDPASFEVRLTLPDSLLVWATGELQQPEAHYQPEVLARWQAAGNSDSTVQVWSPESGSPALLPTAAGEHTWHFVAGEAPDFSFAASDRCVWDAASLALDGRENRIKVVACYRPGARFFEQAVAFGRVAIEDLSTRQPAVPFPYPSLTIFQASESGGGGMEYPMMVNNDVAGSESSTFDLIYHEIAHTYFPFYMGIDEQRYAWMDEGWASFLPLDQMQKRGYEPYPLQNELYGYAMVAGSRLEAPLMQPSVEKKMISYYVSAYNKSALSYWMLRDLLGQAQFVAGMQTYIERWHGKHPLPYDFFFTFDEIAGEDLSWFWRPWFFEALRPDLGLKKVKARRNKVKFIVRNRSGLPLPVQLTFTLENGEKIERRYPLSVWKEGESEVTFKEKFSAPVARILLGHPEIPDMKQDDNEWGK